MTFNIAINLPFDDAIAAAKARGVLLPEAYYQDLPAAKRREAQTVSRLAALGQVQSVIDRLNQHVADGGTLADFQKWAAGQDLGLTRPHLETIFRNGVQTAYNAGHWRAFEENAEDRPYLMYDAINDSRTRPAHSKLDGIIRKIDDPFWNTHSPMLGHRCRCRLISLNQEQALARSRNGKGLNKAETDEMQADGPGWGGKPTEWEKTLEGVKAEKLAKANEKLREVAKQGDNAGMKKHPLAVPNAEQATFRNEKLLKYALDPESKEGKHKARVFASALGYTKANFIELKSKILDGLLQQPALIGISDAHGQRFTVEIPVVGPLGSAIVKTGWIIRPETEAPDLVTLFIDGEGKNENI